MTDTFSAPFNETPGLAEKVMDELTGKAHRTSNTLVQRLRMDADAIGMADVDDVSDAMHEAADEIERLQLQVSDDGWRIKTLIEQRDQLRAALESIAGNTCCDRCQEAALVAQVALKGDTVGFSRPAENGSV